MASSLPKDAAYIEEDVRVEILKRLPVKSICRFRCVCKWWNSLISSSLFITLHHKFTLSNTPAHQKPYLLMDANIFQKNLRCELLYQPPQTAIAITAANYDDTRTYLDLPSSISMDQYSRYRVVGVINGVVCITSLRVSIAIWNPAIRKPIYHKYYPKHVNANVGFGFDAAKNDFKVVVISHKDPWYEVLSVKDGTWKRKSIPPSIYERCHTRRLQRQKRPMSTTPGFFIDKTKTIYWGCQLEDDDLVLLLFDCESEELRTMELPRELAEGHPLTFLKHHDMLSVLRSIKWWPVSPVSEDELWVMTGEESGLCNCTKWKRLLTIIDGRLPAVSPDAPVFIGHVATIGPGNVYQPLHTQVLDQSLFLMDVKPTPPLIVDQPLPRFSDLGTVLYEKCFWLAKPKKR